MRITSAIEIRRYAEWVFKIEMGDSVGLYSLTACEAFWKSDSRFSLKRLGSRVSIDEFAIQRFDKPPESIYIGDQSWKNLAPVPQNGGVCALLNFH